mmetsp:Transcript_55375/g.63289  ORF Transcript_55375/g.63289 Transcript_55375/m.63289 type:complete len:570 (+) Transcript_55375:36-1745(+)
MFAPVRSNSSELQKKLKSFECCCKREGDIIGFCTDDRVFVCKDCLVDHSSHLKAMETISDYDYGLKLLQKTFKQPKCANHPTETQGFYCFDEKSFVCLQCRSRCDSSGHITEFFEYILNQRIEEFEGVCHRMNSSVYDEFDRFRKNQIKKFNNVFYELIKTIERKRKAILKQYQECFNEAARKYGILTPTLKDEWEECKKHLETSDDCDFISQTSEGSAFKTFWQEKMSAVPSPQHAETFLPTLKTPSPECLSLGFLDDLIFDPSAIIVSSARSFMVQHNTKTLLQRSPSNQKGSKKRSWPIPNHLLATNSPFISAPSITTHTTTITQANNNTTTSTIVYLSGGHHSDYNNIYSNRLLSFDHHHQWRQVCKLPYYNGDRGGVAGHGFSCSPDGNTLYVVGGHIGSGKLKHCWSYDLVAGEWSKLPDLPYGMDQGSCFCYGGDSDGYCVVFCSTDCDEGCAGVFVLNVPGYPSGHGGRFDVAVWTPVDNVAFEADDYYLQAFQWRNDRAVILCANGKAWKLKLGKEFKLEKLNLNTKLFWSRAGFCLDGNILGVLGDGGHWNEIKTERLI